MFYARRDERYLLGTRSTVGVDGMSLFQRSSDPVFGMKDEGNESQAYVLRSHFAQQGRIVEGDSLDANSLTAGR